MRELFKFFLFALAVAIGFSMLVDNFTRSAERVDVRVFSPSAVAEGDTAVAIVGNGNQVRLGQEEVPVSNNGVFEFIKEAFIAFGIALVFLLFIGTIALMSYSRSGGNSKEKSPPDGWDSWV
jgi:hypothetical protein